MTHNKWAQSGIEPCLEDMMKDPIVELIMARDNLKKDDVWKVVHSAKQQIEQRAA
ncbi:conserved hypothetical protein [Candidatus Terasakiella magnetica]|uniref:Uncharacterized protein n=1 Tax=Candidatus Terasakiella magnetica TaxID=1867952 RepID=A0A1C3RC06_9PROT|nr:conserved hypothetical protein [Candidatus Terasakiella magnetica]